jgi:hypothetical protein
VVKKGAAAKWTARLQRNISAYPSVSAPMMIRMEQVNSPGSALSPMQSRLLRMLERGQLQNAPHRHHSPCTCPPVLHPTCKHTLSQCTCLRCIHRCTSLYHQSLIHNPHTSNTLVHSQPLHFTHPCTRLTTHSLLPLK